MAAFLSISIACVATAAALAQRDSMLRRTTGTEPETARAAIVDTRGATVGDAMLRETPNGVLLKVDLRNIEAGVHALHVHAVGKCERPDFTSAGGHWAPEGRQHGILDPKGPHAGDLPNVHVFAAGKASVELFLKEVRLGAGTHPLLDADGAALVLHAGEDDYHTNPAGDAGDRIACGVIAR